MSCCCNLVASVESAEESAAGLTCQRPWGEGGHSSLIIAGVKNKCTCKLVYITAAFSGSTCRVKTIYLDRMLLSFSMMTRATMQMKKMAYLVFMLEFDVQTRHLGAEVCHSLSRRG